MKTPIELAQEITDNTFMTKADREQIAVYLRCLHDIHAAMNEQGQWDSDTPEYVADLLASVGLTMDDDPGLMPGENDECSLCGQTIHDESVSPVGALFCITCREDQAEDAAEYGDHEL